jgi:hypothetical protein
MSAVEELWQAAATLRETLPGDLTATPRLVMTDAETLSGIAFCVDHLLPLEGEHELSACDHCEVIDCLYEPLAALLHELLLAREPLADLLDALADQFERDHRYKPPGFTCHCWESDPPLVAALAAAHAINGREASHG